MSDQPTDKPSDPADLPPPLPRSAPGGSDTGAVPPRLPSRQLPPPSQAPVTNDSANQKQYICCECGTMNSFKTSGKNTFQKGCLIALTIMFLTPPAIGLIVFAVAGIVYGEFIAHFIIGFGIVIAYVVVFFLIALILLMAWHFIFRKSEVKRVCLSCGSTENVPLDTPRGQELYRKFYGQNS
ncbi:hypothetical protein QPK87_04035 [Kamptonema cortianum]|nr:hypothetical protein [Kamptonema cortianum]MDL5048048.1 hypothetical protein [Oscillatoria amoena NRMC-F 0135]